mgnify:CR=1 FL=1|jgi:hypothetical protein
MADKSSGSEGDNLSRIKDILFGEDLQSIENKLDTVKDASSSAYEKLKAELDDRFKKMDMLLQEKLKEVEKVHSDSKENQSNINDELKQTIANINTEISNEKNYLENRVNESVEQTAKSLSTLEEAINNTIDKVKQYNEMQVNDLRKNNINKDVLADILTELAEKLRK